MIAISDIKKRLPSILWISCCIGFLIFFVSPVNQLLNRLLVKPLISEFANSLLNESILMLLSVLAAAWLYLFSEKKFLRKLAIFATLFYVLQLNQQLWHFHPILLIPILREWDIVVAALIIPGMLTFITKRSIQDTAINRNGFIEDLAIESVEQDTFNRKEVAREIAEKISITNNSKSFAIGILGEYGSGKTSFINLIKNYLDKTNTEIVDFNPWSVDGTPNIQKDFFDLLASCLYALNPKVSGMILDYSRKLSRVDSSAEKFIRQIGFANSLFKNGSYTDDYDRINHLLEKSGKKIVITIDDLDRLYKEEVMEVMRLIRNTASFTNIFYLVAYERSYIQESIKSMNANVGSSYLDKIIQLEIPLPKRESEDLLRVLESLLESFITANHMEAYRSHIRETGFRNQYNFAFRTIFRQSRDVIKFINNFKIAYRFLGQEVLFESLFVLELLKFRFPLIYDRLFEKRDDFILVTPSRSTHEEYYKLRTYRVKKDDLLLIGRMLREEKSYDEAEITLICGLLGNLFFRFSRSTMAKNAIMYPMFFERYFRYRLSGRDISEKLFQEAWHHGLSGVKQFVDRCEEDKLLAELCMRILQEKAKTRACFELKLKSLFYLGARYVKEKGRHSFDYMALIDLLWNYDHIIDKRYYKKDENAYRLFVESLFEEAETPFVFPAEIIYNIKHDKKEISVPTTVLVDFQVRYFMAHVAEHGLTKDASWMFWGIRDEYTEPAPGQPGYEIKHFRFEPPVIPFVKAALREHDPFEFLKLAIKYDMREKEIVAIHPELLAIFETPEEYRDLIIANTKINPDIKADFLAFFEACKEKDFNNWANYEFKTALKPERSDND
ncbi:KAP family P-loop domain-containing protein [Chitinophaga sp. CF118]|uniref:KAP family P-loop NTPase fold protein n=1 Tax=Chitinophaga sp. CF118 TaxID=1884367 RepID=UPI0008E03C66|nr:P-loop NTPase fold protein [Chitinophaga sp. CF118]SFF07525.1 KAP family P-loop domain-containing protein [Chitinophaga sp. CF118]